METPATNNHEVTLSPDLTTWMPTLQTMLAEIDTLPTEAEKTERLKEICTGQMEMTVEILQDLLAFLMALTDTIEDMGFTIDDFNKVGTGKSEKMKFFMKLSKAAISMVDWKPDPKNSEAFNKVINNYSPFYLHLKQQRELEAATDYKAINK